MSSEGEPPTNNSIRSISGGAEAMKNLSREMKEGGRSAIVVLENDGGNSRFRGYISFRDGAIVEALYKESSDDGKTDSKSGREALQRVWREALNPAVKMKIYNLVPKDAKWPEGKESENMSARALTARKVKKLKSQETDDATLLQARAWKKEGYNVEDLIDKIESDGQDAFRLYMEYDAKIKRLKNLEKSLYDLQGRGFDADYKRLTNIVREPQRISELELGIGLLKRKMESRSTRSSGRHLEQLQETRSDYDEVYTVVFGAERVRPADGRCPNCGAKMSGNVCDICGKSMGHEDKGGSGLIGGMNFDNFIVGSSNKFAYAACVSIANASPDQYNPLYIYAATGLGKTHLLNAIGNHLKHERKSAHILYLGADRFSDEVMGAKRESVESYTASLKGLDMLLLDDIQFLAGKEEAQGHLLNVVQSMLRDGKNVVVAGDKQAKDIKAIDSQLITRLESGLQVDMRPPDIETRTKILEMKVKDEKYQMPQSVLKYIAETVEDNIRELTGSLNRVVAYSTLMKIPPTVETAKRILRTNSQEQRKENRGRIELRPGHGYIIEEDRASLCHMLVQEKLQENWTALDITRVNPTRLRTKFPGLEKARVVWLTDRESDKEITLLPSLEKIEYEIKNFMESASRGNGRAIVNVDDIQYVISNTNFEGTVRLLRRMVDEMSERNSVLIISVGKETLAKQEIAILERELELIQ